LPPVFCVLRAVLDELPSSGISVSASTLKMCSSTTRLFLAESRGAAEHFGALADRFADAEVSPCSSLLSHGLSDRIITRPVGFIGVASGMIKVKHDGVSNSRWNPLQRYACLISGLDV